MSWSVDAQNHLLARGGFAPRWLLWVWAKEYIGGAEVGFGIWNGDDNLTLEINGVDRLYYGAQGHFVVEPIIYSSALEVRTQKVSLSELTPEAETLARGYDLKNARAELHLALLDPASFSLIDVERQFKGFVNAAPIITPPVGGGGSSIEMELASASRKLTQTLAVKKSDQSQRLRNSTDAFRQYGSIAAAVTTQWDMV